MQFKRSKGNFRQKTDRVVRFKLLNQEKIGHRGINGCSRPFRVVQASGGDHHYNVQQDQIEKSKA